MTEPPRDPRLVAAEQAQAMYKLLGSDPVARMATNCLGRFGILTPQDLLDADEYDIKDIKNLGAKSFNRILEARNRLRRAASGEPEEAVPEEAVPDEPMNRVSALRHIRGAVTEEDFKALAFDGEVVAQVMDDLDQARETNRRLNRRCQEAESVTAVFKKAVGEWELAEVDGKQHTYIPLRTLTAIAKAAGKEFDSSYYTHHSDRMCELEERLDRYEKDNPYWTHGAPEDYNAWLRELIPNDRLLAFYQWVGRMAVSEALGDVRVQVSNDPVPVEHRYYTQESVYEFLDWPEEGGPYPSQLPPSSLDAKGQS